MGDVSVPDTRLSLDAKLRGPAMFGFVLPATGVVSTETATAAPAARLFPEEAAHIANAVPKRRAEFSTVRACADAALRALGATRPPQVPGKGGMPPWPTGIVGSMTHCAGRYAAAVARTSSFRGLGIDAEPRVPLPEGILESISSTEERASLQRLWREVPEVNWDTILFSAKESVYKAWYPLARATLDFTDGSIVIGHDGTFSAQLDVAAPAWLPRSFDGRWAVGEGLIVTAVTVPR